MRTTVWVLEMPGLGSSIRLMVSPDLSLITCLPLEGGFDGFHLG